MFHLFPNEQLLQMVSRGLKKFVVRDMSREAFSMASETRVGLGSLDSVWGGVNARPCISRKNSGGFSFVLYMYIRILYLVPVYVYVHV